MVSATHLSDAAVRYVSGYLSIDIQDAAAGPTDPQLASIIISVLERVAATDTGVIVDIGCGTGVLFARLIEEEIFKKATGWLYVGVDTDENLDTLHTLARRHRLSRRVELISLASFYADWPQFGSPQLIFCRNVFHELNIYESAALLLHMSKNSRKEDLVIIQDLMKFPVGEHGNACWIPERLQACVGSFGFDAVTVSQRSPSGNAWFNLLAKRNDSEAPADIESRQIVNKARYQQWEIWTDVEKTSVVELSRRDEVVEEIDLELQLAALTRQLRDAGAIGLPVGPDVEKKIRVSEFARRIDNLVKMNSPSGIEISEQVHFRERGEQLTVLESFLRGDDRIAVINGGSGTGKTTIANRILATRAYEKAVVVVDGRSTRSFWSFIEAVFAQVGLRLAPELLSVIGDTRLSAIEPALKQFMNAYAHRTILFYDNFSHVHESDGSFPDQALGAVLELWASKPGAKVLVGSVRAFIPAPLQRATGGVPITVRVGRYGQDQTVINVLDDKFDRRAAGVDEYPPSLLAVIDRHPLIASLAAQNLQKHGANLLLDNRFINELKFRLREQLWNRLVDAATLPVLEIASQLRTAVPRQMLKQFSPEESIYAGLESELLRSFPDERWDSILAVLGVFRLRDIALDETSLGGELPVDVHHAVNHARISDAYRAIYRQDDDPKWIRESYFHAMLSGGQDAIELSQGLGRYYYDELVASANYTYIRRRDYSLALELYETAQKISPLAEQSEMRRASCLVRMNRRALGEAAYDKLVARFPESRGNKTSHVDALLYIHDYSAAEKALEAYKLKPNDDVWIAYEWGRTYLGGDQYKQAVDIFRSILARDSTDVHYHIFYGRCLQYAGAFSEAEKVLRSAVLAFPEAHAAQTALGTTLEQNEKLEEAQEWLEPLFAERDDNIQAAASLIRVSRLAGRRAEAASIFRRAERNCPPQFQEYLVAARIEMMLMDGGFESSVDEACQKLEDTAYSKYILYRTFSDAMALASDEVRDRLRLVARRTGLPSRYRLNALAQLQRLRVARLSGDTALEAEVLAALKETSVTI